MIFIHAGYPKTATTAVQRALCERPEALKKAGILYPEAGRPESREYGHHNISWSFKSHRSNRLFSQKAGDLGDVYREWKSSGCPSLIVSSEGLIEPLAKAPEAVAEEVDQYFNRHDIRLIFVLRRADRYFESSYLQDLRLWANGRLRTRLPTLQARLSEKMRNPVEHLRPVVNGVRFFGQSSCIVVPYREGFWEHFLSIIGMAGADVGLPRQNASLTLKQACVLSHLASSEHWETYQNIILANRKQWASTVRFDEDREDYSFVDQKTLDILKGKMADEYQEIFGRQPFTWEQGREVYECSLAMLKESEVVRLSWLFGSTVG